MTAAAPAWSNAAGLKASPVHLAVANSLVSSVAAKLKIRLTALHLGQPDPNIKSKFMSNTAKQLSSIARAIRRRKTHFWGRDYFVTPRLVNWIEGDGRKVITFTPLATRPDRFIVRLDSKTNIESDSFSDITLEAIYEAIENQFGASEEDWEHTNGRTYHRHRDWPALNSSCGAAWDHLLTLKKKDSRTEETVRSEIFMTASRRRRIYPTI